MGGDIIGVGSATSPGFDRYKVEDGPGPQTVAVVADKLDGAEKLTDSVEVQESTETYDDGSSYSGHVLDGMRHGHGVWTAATEQYKGQWKNDQRHGHGVQTWQDGRIYDGQFQDGKFVGRGKMEWHTPTGLMVYEGDYVDDLKHGHGLYKWPDKRIYDGQWCHGKRTGEASYTNSMGEMRRAIWQDDKVERWLDDDPVVGGQAAPAT